MVMAEQVQYAVDGQQLQLGGQFVALVARLPLGG